MKKFIIPLITALSLQGGYGAISEEDPPLLQPEEKQAVDAQKAELNRALVPALTEGARSTVRVWSGRTRLAYGTVIGDGHRVLTKWSEVARATGKIYVQSARGEAVTANIVGVYSDEDLAVLEFTGTALKPVKWSSDPVKLGSFLVAPQPEGIPAGSGVVSVLDRNLRVTDHAYLGVMGAFNYNGPGVKIQDVAADSGAGIAGLKPGNVILKVGDRPISGILELRNALVGVKPGSRVKLLVLTGEHERPFEVVLGNRPNLPKFPDDRLQMMEQMGGKTSRVRDSFSCVIQSDMRLKPDQVGGPVVDLKGRVVGLSMAQAGRTSSYVMPAAAVENLLKKQPENPALVTARRDDRPAARPHQTMVPQRRVMPGNRERMQRHMKEMQRLMDFMREEMNGLEPDR